MVHHALHMSEDVVRPWLVRQPFIIGYFGLAILCFVLFFTEGIMLELVLIIIGSIFISFVEPIKEIFFFRQVNALEEEQYYSLFNTSGAVGSFLGKFSIAGVLLFLPSNFAYFVTGIFMVLFALVAKSVSPEQH